MKSHPPRKYSIRNTDTCIKCNSKFNSIIYFEVEGKQIILTKQCWECGNQELIKRSYNVRSGEK